MHWLRSLTPAAPVVAALALVALVAILAVAGPWTPVVAPALVQVTALTPTDLEPGDRIAIAGEGFPAGKEARVTFRGALHRPGEPPVNDVEVVAPGIVVGPEEVDVDFTESTQALFCRAGDRASHTTFVGDVEVAFAAAVRGAAPVAGVLRHAVLDVRPSLSVADRSRDAEGRKTMELVGLHFAIPTRRGLGLTVQSVDPGSRAASAAIVAGDVVTSFDGVRAAALADLVPIPGEREATLGVRSDGEAVETLRSLPVGGLRVAPVADFVGGVLLVIAALSVLVFFGRAAPAGLGAAIQEAGSRLRARAQDPLKTSQSRRSGEARVVRTTMLAAVRQALPPASASMAVDASVVALLGVLPFGQYLVAARLDVGILFVGATTAVVIAAVAVVRSAFEGLRSALHLTWQHVPGALAVASVVFTTGSLRVEDIDRAQGGWPWDWLAFRSPAALVALLLLLECAALEPEGDRPRSELEALSRDERLPTSVPTGVSRGPWVAAACRAHRFIVAGLATALFLGGWSLPGLSAAQQDGRLELETIGAAWFLAKTWAVVLVVSVVQWSRPAIGLREGTRATTLRRLPVAVAVLAATVAWTAWSSATLASSARAAQLLVSGSLVVVTALGMAAVVHRVRHALAASGMSAGSDGHLSPFL